MLKISSPTPIPTTSTSPVGTESSVEDIMSLLQRLEPRLEEKKPKGDLRIRLEDQQSAVAGHLVPSSSPPVDGPSSSPSVLRRFAAKQTDKKASLLSTDYKSASTSNLLASNLPESAATSPSTSLPSDSSSSSSSSASNGSSIKRPQHKELGNFSSSDDGLDKMFDLVVKMNTGVAKGDLRIFSDERMPHENSEGSVGMRKQRSFSLTPGTSSSDLQQMLQNEHAVRIGPWAITETIGSGATAEVKLAIHQTTGSKRAIKIIEKSKFGAKSILLMAREIAIMKFLRHPHVTPLEDLFETETHLYLVMPYIEGETLFDSLINATEKLSMAKTSIYMGQVFSGLAYMHKHRICHRDIKPENILTFKGRDHLILCDFGLSRLTVRDNAKVLCNTQCGSFGYLAPEQLRKLPYDGEKSDVWAMGIIIYILLVGCHPFDQGEHESITMKRVLSGVFEIPSTVPPKWVDLIQKLLRVDPNERITAEQAIEHPAISEHYVYDRSLNNLRAEVAKYSAPIAAGVDETVMKSFEHMEWGKHKEIKEKLEAKDEGSLEKVFYHAFSLYETRRQKAAKTSTAPPEPPLERTKTLNYTVEKVFQDFAGSNGEAVLMEAFITRHETIKEGNVFLVQVEVRDKDGWSVHTFRKKHSDFRKLHEKLKKSLGGPSKFDISFPTTSIMTSLTSKERQGKEKKDLLNTWLRLVTQHSVASKSPLLKAFFPMNVQ